MKYINSYALLDPRLYHKQLPTPLDNPKAGHFNPIVAEQLGWDNDPDLMENWVRILGGHDVPDGFEPLAMVYAGHQFGQWAGQLGDGRGLLMAQVLDRNGNITDLHLKGIGLTPYSRQGDGRAVLRSTIREYLCGHAMSQLGVASSNALGFVTSGTPVRREQIEQGAALMRVADTHIRLGHVEWIASYEPDLLPEFTRYMMETYYPDVMTSSTPVHDFVAHVVSRTAKMIANWQLVGFAHGVMNTDNLSITGSTLDYGPFGFLERFNPAWINNHSDYSGRYAYQNQPAIGYWNMQTWARHFARLSDIEVIAGVTESIDKDSLDACLALYEPHFMRHYQQGVSRKLGLPWVTADDSSDGSLDIDKNEKLSIQIVPEVQSLLPIEHINQTLRLAFDWLEIMEQNQIDYTNGWRALVALADPNNLDKHHYEADLLATIIKELEDAKMLTCKDTGSNIQPIDTFNDWRTRYQAHVNRHLDLIQNLDLDVTEVNAPITPSNVADIIKQTNPAYILRNGIAQKAIEYAENGDFSDVDRVFQLLTDPYTVKDTAAGLATQADITPPAKDAKPLVISCSS